MPLVEGRNWSWNTGDPGQEAEAQVKAIGGNSGWVFDEAESGYRSAFSHEREQRGRDTMRSIWTRRMCTRS